MIKTNNDWIRNDCIICGKDIGLPRRQTCSGDCGVELKEIYEAEYKLLQMDRRNLNFRKDNLILRELLGNNDTTT